MPAYFTYSLRTSTPSTLRVYAEYAEVRRATPALYVEYAEVRRGTLALYVEYAEGVRRVR